MTKRVISAVLKMSDDNFSSGLKKASSGLTDFERKSIKVGNSIENFGRKTTETFKSVAKIATGVIATGFAAVSVTAGKTIFEMNDAFNMLENQTGATAAQMKEYESAAKSVFGKGYGENIDEVTNALARVKQNMHNIDNGEISKVTSNSMLLAKTFDSDINEVTRGANNMMEAFGITADKAFDLFTAGGQRGLNFSNEMFDNVAEYSSLFGAMGYSAEEYFGIMERGAKAGVYNLDYVNDVMKEFQIRAKDGSKATSEAMGALSKNTQNVWKEFSKGNGTVSDVASTVVGELKGMDDQITANQIAVSLFGTKWEDLESDAMYAMLGTQGAMKNFEGAMESASAKTENNIKNRLVGAWRNLQVGIADTVNGAGAQEFLGSVATKAEELVPKIIGVVESAVNLGNTIKQYWIPARETVIALSSAVVAGGIAFGTLKIVTTIAGALKGFTTVGATATVVMRGFNAAIKANPIGAAVTAVMLLTAAGVTLYRNWDTVKSKWNSVMDTIKSVTERTVNVVIENINKMIELINRIPGVNIPIIPKVDWSHIGTMPAQDNRIANGSTSEVKMLSSYDVGSNRISHDQVAQIHKDEMVLPARQAQRVRAAGGNIDNIDQLVTQQQQVVSITSGQNRENGISIVIENITAAGVTVAELVNELVTELKLTLANI